MNLSHPIAQPKPIPRKRLKARKVRKESVITRVVRAIVSARDGECRLAGVAVVDSCDGPREWAHLEDSRRFKTRGRRPEQRHTTAGTAMLCRVHHRQYDAHRFRIEFLTEAGADGPLAFHTRDGVYLEVRQ